jgi:copper(I)-binding protein
MRALFPVVMVAATAALSGCQQPREIRADHAYVRLPAVKGNPAVAYFSLHGGPADNVLVSVTSPVVIRSELHESMSGNMAGHAMASMTPVQSVPLPADGTVEFKPGGKHVMLYGVNAVVKPGDTINLVFTFADNQRVQTDATVIAAGDQPPK